MDNQYVQKPAVEIREGIFRSMIYEKPDADRDRLYQRAVGRTGIASLTGLQLWRNFPGFTLQQILMKYLNQKD